MTTISNSRESLFEVRPPKKEKKKEKKKKRKKEKKKKRKKMSEGRVFAGNSQPGRARSAKGEERRKGKCKSCYILSLNILTTASKTKKVLPNLNAA